MHSRRDALLAFGAGLAASVVPSRLLDLGDMQPEAGTTVVEIPAPMSPPSSPVVPVSTRAQIVDADFDVTPYLGRLRNAGIKTVGRYYDRAYGTGIGETCYRNKTKILTKAELAAIENAGMSVYVVFQHCGAQCVNFDLKNPATADKGRKDAEAAAGLARELGQPAGTPVYFAIDFDPSPGADCQLPAARIWPSIEAYFDQVNEVFAGTEWQVGVYGAGITCRRLKAADKAKFFWVSTSLGHVGTPEFFNGGGWHIFQNLTEIKRKYAPDTFDTDVANPEQTYFGQWTSGGPALPHGAVEAGEILASRAFVKKGCVVTRSPKSRSAMHATRFSTTCRIMTPEESGFFGVSLTEDDAIDGYVHKDDLVRGLQRNMPAWQTSKRCASPAEHRDMAGVEALLLPLRR